MDYTNFNDNRVDAGRPQYRKDVFAGDGERLGTEFVVAFHVSLIVEIHGWFPLTVEIHHQPDIVVRAKSLAQREHNGRCGPVDESRISWQADPGVGVVPGARPFAAFLGDVVRQPALVGNGHVSGAVHGSRESVSVADIGQDREHIIIAVEIEARGRLRTRRSITVAVAAVFEVSKFHIFAGFGPPNGQFPDLLAGSRSRSTVVL